DGRRLPGAGESLHRESTPLSSPRGGRGRPRETNRHPTTDRHDLPNNGRVRDSHPVSRRCSRGSHHGRLGRNAAQIAANRPLWAAASVCSEALDQARIDGPIAEATETVLSTRPTVKRAQAKQSRAAECEDSAGRARSDGAAEIASGRFGFHRCQTILLTPARPV